MSKADKKHYGFDHYMDKLVELGRQTEPGKYTPDYVKYLRSVYGGLGLTVLHGKVLERERILNQVK